MTEKELKKLSRAELLEMLIAQGKKLKRTEDELEKAKEELKKREIAISSSGSVAEAALKLNDIFENADKAAQQYLYSLRNQESQTEKIVADAQEKADNILRMAKAQGRFIIANAEKEAKERVKTIYSKFGGFIESNLKK